MAQTIVYKLEDLLRTFDDRRVFLVCGSSFDRLGLQQVLEQLEVVRFSGFSPNPVYEDVCRAVSLFRETGCDGILAIGGGSAMDVAKCVKLFSAMDPSVNYLQQQYTDTGIPLAAVPTTAGTGSESTRHAVIYYRGQKQSISHPSLVPDCACLLPGVLKQLPAYQKKCTMLDALCQAIESWWSVGSTEESRAFSKEAVELICRWWRPYILENREEAAQKILLAANCSGRAINITATTAPHAMSYTLTSLYGIPHGHAVALCLPEVWEYMLREEAVCTDSRGKAHLQQIFSEIPLDLRGFRQLLSQLGTDRPVSGCKEAELDVLTRSVNSERLRNNPVLLDAQTIKSMYERILL